MKSKNQSLIKAALEYVSLFLEENGKNFLFHNYHLILQNVKTFKEISKNEKLTHDETEIAKLAIVFKDVGITGSESKELESQMVIDDFLNKVNLTPLQSEDFNSLMNFIRGNNEPRNKLEQVLRDSVDIYLAYPDALERMNLFRMEQELLYGKIYDDIDWLEFCKRYYVTHNFFTRYAKEKYGLQRNKNFLELERLIYKMKPDKHIQSKSSVMDMSNEPLTYKEAEDLFKMTFRNYLDLITVADRKAELMIQVNSIMVSVVIAFSLRRLDDHPLFMLPIIGILLVAIATIYFAIMASKPQEKIQRNTGVNDNQVFFFGSFDRVDNGFIKISWEEYKNRMRDLASGNRGEVMQQIAQETFMVRKILAQKFKYISFAYRVFKYGLIIIVVSFLCFYILSI